MVVDGCHLCVVYFVFTSQIEFSECLLDFNASLNDVAPMSPILLSVDLMGIEEWIVDGCHLCAVSFWCSPVRLS